MTDTHWLSLTHPGLESLNAQKVFLIITWKKDVCTIIQNTNTIIQTLVPSYTHAHTPPPTHTHHTHRGGPDSSAPLTASPDLPFVTVPFKKTCFNGNDFQKNIEPIMENVLQQLRSPSSKGGKQKRGQTASVTFRLSPPRRALPSSGRLFKVHGVSVWLVHQRTTAFQYIYFLPFPLW